MSSTNQFAPPPAPGWHRRWWRELKTEESGQNLLEYTLLLAAIGLTAAAFLIGVGQLTYGLFQIANSRLASASQ
jgi:Flp pilus assembly pilin Flp